MCNTKISVLRHYDKAGLLQPDYIDRFTGYRYYSKDQAKDFFFLCELKKAGFSLSEIRDVMKKKANGESIEDIFDEKDALLKETLFALSKAKRELDSSSACKDVRFAKKNGALVAVYNGPLPCDRESACISLDTAVTCEDCQRISPFRCEKDEDGNPMLLCDVIKLSKDYSRIDDPPCPIFEDDKEVVGKWQVVGEYACLEDFLFRSNTKHIKTYKKDDLIYFLPKGEDYWCYSWTRGQLIIITGNEDRSVNDYTTKKIGADTFMFVELKSYYYRRGGKPTLLVLRRLDNVSYSKELLAKTDNMDLPFVADPRIVGKWKCVDFVKSTLQFDPETPPSFELFYMSAEFFEDGTLISSFSNGAVISSKSAQEWTRGFVLQKWIKAACAYKIQKISKKDYLFLEWKSGDYTYGKKISGHYVFERCE